MPLLVSIPVLGLLVVLQSAIVSRIPLLHGTADLMLLGLIAWAVHSRVKTAWQWALIGGLMISFVSAAPSLVAMLGYPLATAVALALRRWVWQVPLLAMITATLAGTLIIHALTVLGLRFYDTPISLVEVFNLITLPSAILNLLLAVPIYAIISDLANWVHPEEIEI